MADRLFKDALLIRSAI